MVKELPSLRSFSYETAAEHLHTRVPVASPSSPMDEIRRSLGANGYYSLTHIAILEGTKLVGGLTIENLFSTPEGSVAGQVMDPQPPVVAPGTDQEVAALRAVEHGESASRAPWYSATGRAADLRAGRAVLLQATKADRFWATPRP